MIGFAIMILLSALIAGSIKDEFHEAFSGDWLRFDEDPYMEEEI